MGLISPSYKRRYSRHVATPFVGTMPVRICGYEELMGTLAYGFYHSRNTATAGVHFLHTTSSAPR
jgi:hypothetical protein